MAIARLVPRSLTYTSGYTIVTDEDNAFTDTDSDTYATVSAQISYNIPFQLRDFDFSLIPAGATVNSFALKVKASSNIASGSYRTVRFRIAKGDTNILQVASETATIYTLANGSYTWADIIQDMSPTGYPYFYFDCDLSASKWIRIYGAEIYVDYTPAPKIFNLILPKGA